MITELSSENLELLVFNKLIKFDDVLSEYVYTTRTMAYYCLECITSNEHPDFNTNKYCDLRDDRRKAKGLQKHYDCFFKKDLEVRISILHFA